MYATFICTTITAYISWSAGFWIFISGVQNLFEFTNKMNGFQTNSCILLINVQRLGIILEKVISNLKLKSLLSFRG